MIVLLDKPAGITSASAVRRICKAALLRGGHTGTLDPGATGLLVVCLDQARKLVSMLTGHDKTYRTTIELGTETNTLDRWGDVVQTRPVPSLSPDGIEAVLARFVGETSQIVPAFSAVKVNGQPLHRRARRGADVDCPVRQITIHGLRLLKLEKNRFDLEVRCGAGTYIRALARDIAVELSTVGHVVELRRLCVGTLDVAEAHTIEEILEVASAGQLRRLSCDTSLALAGRRLLVADPDAVSQLRMGRSVPIGDLQSRTDGDEPAVILDEAGQLVAIVNIEENQAHPKRVMLDPDRQ